MDKNIKKAFLHFWWLSAIFLFLILWKLVQILNPDMSIPDLKKKIFIWNNSYCRFVLGYFLF